jgi:hypothetical protein
MHTYTRIKNIITTTVYSIYFYNHAVKLNHSIYLIFFDRMLEISYLFDFLDFPVFGLKMAELVE